MSDRFLQAHTLSFQRLSNDAHSCSESTFLISIHTVVGSNADIVKRGAGAGGQGVVVGASWLATPGLYVCVLDGCGTKLCCSSVAQHALLCRHG